MLLSERELDIPEGVDPEHNPSELIRFWVSGGIDHVSLRFGTFEPAEDEPRMWGWILADIAKHLVRALRQDDPSRGSVEELISQIEAGFGERTSQNPDLLGRIVGRNH
jgi:hypothetical protein